MRKGFMNHWIILYSGTYVYEGGGNQENKRNNKTEFNQQKNF